MKEERKFFVNAGFFFLAFAFVFAVIPFASASLNDELDELKVRECMIESYSVADASSLSSVFVIRPLVSDCTIFVDEYPFSQRIIDQGTIEFNTTLFYGLVYKSSAFDKDADYFFVLGKNSAATSYLISVLSNYEENHEYFSNDLALFFDESSPAEFSSAPESCSADLFINEYTPVTIGNYSSSCLNSETAVFPRCDNSMISFSYYSCQYGCYNKACRSSAVQSTQPGQEGTGTGGGGSSGGSGAGSSTGSSTGSVGSTGGAGSLTEGEDLEENENIDDTEGDLEGEEEITEKQDNVFASFVKLIKSFLKSLFVKN